MKRFLSLLLSAFLLLSLAACGASPSPGPEPSPDPAAPEETPRIQAVTALRALDREGEASGICALDGSRVLVQFGALSDEKDPAERMYGTWLSLVDTQQDSVLQTVSLDGDEILLGALPGGEVLTVSYEQPSLNVYREDLTPVRTVALPDGCDGSGVYDVTPCFLPESGKCLLAVSWPGSGPMGRIRLYLADLEALEYTGTLAPAAPDGEQAVRACREENRKLLRSLADGIQADYPVTVLLGDECLKVEPAPTYAYVSTDAVKTDTSLESWRMLTSLRETLGRLPDGFLERFRDGGGGLRFLLVSELRNERFKSFDAGGVTYTTREGGVWYNIAVETAEQSAILSHELWHAVEDRLDEENYPAFDSGDWWPLNPYGFEYFYDLDTFEAQSSSWNWSLLDWGDDPYFIRAYSTVNDMEDRATLIEAIYSGFYGKDPASSLEAIRSCPHLAAKLDLMADRVRAVFGSVYWEGQN